GRSLIALRVALGCGRDRVLRLGFRRARRQVRRRLVLVLAGDRVLELAHALAERAPHLGQPLRAEDEQDDHEQNCDLLGADPSRHCPARVARFALAVLLVRNTGKKGWRLDWVQCHFWRSRTCTSRSRTAPRSSRVSISPSSRGKCTRSWGRTARASPRSRTR